MADSDDTRRRDDSAAQAASVSDRAHLRAVAGKDSGGTRVVPRRGLLLGRVGAQLAPEEVEDAWLLDDPWISRRQARLACTGGLWHLSDAGASNPAFVDGVPLPRDGERALADGAVIRLGDTSLVFRLGEGVGEPPDSAAQRVEERWFPGISPSAQQVRRRLAHLQRSLGHVLVLGETGTGKERVARALGVPDRPFVALNCAELGGDLVRSELFGHVRGSFSGAVAKEGLIEAAQHGTLFLDEIGELALDVQAELLRFLEDGGYRQVGATELRRSKARVVAATNVDLDEAVRAGRFRRDLLARLRAHNAPLVLPPLRERREDVLPWAEHFLAEAQRTSTSVAGSDIDVAQWAAHGPWNPGVAECLLLYPWPDNLRGLRGVMRGLAAQGQPLSLRPEALPAALREHRRTLRAAEQAPVVSAGVNGEAGATSVSTPESEELTREAIEAALASHRGSVRATAQQLGVDRRKLYRACKRVGIDLDNHRGKPEKEG